MEEEKIYYKLTRSELQIIENITGITAKSYQIVNDLMPTSSFFDIAEDLLDEIYSLHDLIDEMKEKEKEQGDMVEEMKIIDLQNRRNEING